MVRLLPALMALVGMAQDFDPSGLKPFTDGAPYLGKFETGLYPGGKNVGPDAHRKAGERLAATIQPLDAEGRSADGGRILALVLGHSNCSMYFGALNARFAQATIAISHSPRIKLSRA